MLSRLSRSLFSSRLSSSLTLSYPLSYSSHSFLLSLVREISSGYLHMGAVTVEGELYTWGNNVGGCAAQPIRYVQCGNQNNSLCVNILTNLRGIPRCVLPHTLHAFTVLYSAFIHCPILCIISLSHTLHSFTVPYSVLWHSCSVSNLTHLPWLVFILFSTKRLLSIITDMK